MTIKGAYGARLTGGGFGGSVVALCQPRSVDLLRNHLTEVYPRKFGHVPGIFVTTAAEGASVVE